MNDTNHKADASRTPLKKATLGTFAGVFTPSLLTILGIILFLRLGYVTGSAGLLRMFIILGIATAISVLTSISLSALATNIRTKGGGDYYLISRTLGLGFGGAIGSVLFLAQAVSVGFYCIGFAEGVGFIVPLLAPFTQVIAALAVLPLFWLAWKGADYATRFQFVVMGVLAVALTSFFIGAIPGWRVPQLEANIWWQSGSPPFWVLFAVFFPAVTGFTQGVSMSGDLADPDKSLPRGTFLAVGLSTLVYLSVVVILAGAATREELVGNYAVMRELAYFGWLVDAGIVAATLSSAMASFMGAPRILQAMARDKVFNFIKPFAQGTGKTDNPRRGVLLTAAIALATIAAGDLNFVAGVVTMFFLISYGLLNHATYFEARSASPSFRPRFRLFTRQAALAGAILCVVAMIAIDAVTAIIAAATLTATYQYIRRRGGVERWSDSSRSHSFQRLRESLLGMDMEVEHARDWRPMILAMSDDAQSRQQLLRFCSWIEGGAGITTLMQIMQGQGAAMRKRRRITEDELRSEIRKEKIEAFPRALLTHEPAVGVHAALQAYGLGPLHANTVVLDWEQETLDLAQRGKSVPADIEGESDDKVYNLYLRTALRMDCNVILLDAGDRDWRLLLESPERRKLIDVWWFNDASSRLNLLLSYLMTRSTDWHDAEIRLLAPVRSQQNSKAALHRMTRMLEDYRIHAQPKLVVDATLNDMVRESAGASLVWVPMRLRAQHPLDPFGNDLNRLMERLPVVAAAIAASDLVLDAEPDEGLAAELAAMLDRCSELEELSKTLQDQLTRAMAEIESLDRNLMELPIDVPEQTKSDLHKKLADARLAADQLTRRMVKTKARAQAARNEAQAFKASISHEAGDIAKPHET
ncbi:MAG: amino acid permease [Phycisphaerales bacterium]|nr:amino acid permease [Phycisphaerales bacterium]